MVPVEDSAALDDSAFVDSGIPANKNVIFNNNGESANWLEDSANLGAGGDVAIAANLRARAHESVGIDHSVFADEGTDVHKHRRHADYAVGDVGSVANAGAAGNNADTVSDGKGV